MKKPRINLKKRKVIMKITFEYEEGSLTPDVILVDATKCSCMECLMAISRIYETMRGMIERNNLLDVTTMLCALVETQLEEALKYGEYKTNNKE